MRGFIIILFTRTVMVISVRRMSLARNVAGMRETSNLHVEFEWKNLKNHL